MKSRRHQCHHCKTLVDVTGLIAYDHGNASGVGAPVGYICRVASACAVRAARTKRTAPRDALLLAHEELPRPCRFCGHTLTPARAIASKGTTPLGASYWIVLFECRSVDSCERRMVKDRR